jgi:protein ImuA
VRNDGPGGAESELVPPPGIARAGGAKNPIERLRAHIRALERVPVSLAIPPAPGTPRPACFPFFSPRQRNVAIVAEASPSPPPFRGRGFPLRRLQQSGLHELKAASYRDGPAALAFALATIGAGLPRRDQAPGLVLWCLTAEAAREWGRPYGLGLIGLGLDPAFFLLVEARNAADAAWALEEGLKSRALVAALAQIEVRAPLIARRLGLAAKASRTPCLLLSGHRGTGLPGALTRWRVAAMASGPARFDAAAPGAPRWHLMLERCRGAAPGQSWTVEWSDASYDFRVVAAFAAGAAAAGQVRTA